MEELQPEDLAFFRELLSSQMDDLLMAAEKTVNSLVQNQEWAPADPLDQAAIDTDRNYTFRMRDRESRLIKKIKTALAKLHEGTFGICESCGQEISVARLRARPTTFFCISCKTQMEAMEKMEGI